MCIIQGALSSSILLHTQQQFWHLQDTHKACIQANTLSLIIFFCLFGMLHQSSLSYSSFGGPIWEPRKKSALESAINTAREEHESRKFLNGVLNYSGEYIDLISKTTLQVVHFHHLRLNRLHESIRYQWCMYKNIITISFCCSSFGGILRIRFCTWMDNQ